MKKILPFILLNLLSLACSNPNLVTENKPTAASPTTQPAIAAADIEVRLTFDIKSVNNGKLKISGETNLPDGTNLMVGIDGKSVNFRGSVTVQVSNGRFETEEFSDKGMPFPPGQYLGSIVMPLSHTQNPAVRAVIGDKAERLKGKLVDTSDSMGLGFTVKTEKPFQIKPDKSISIENNSKATNDSKKDALAVLEALKILESQGRNMEPLRASNNTESMQECGNLMRKYSQTAADLLSKSERFPKSYGMLGVAALELKMCVTCSSTAMESCNNAKSSIAQAQKQFQ